MLQLLRQIMKIILSRGKNREAPSMDAVLNHMDRHAKDIDAAVLPVPESKPRTRFDSGLPIEKMSMANLQPRQRMQAMSKVIPLVMNMNRAAHMYDDGFIPTNNTASPEFIAALEQMAHHWGAKHIRYVEVPPNALFQGKKLPAKYAIVFTVEMDKAPIDTSPSWTSQHEVMRGYKNMAVISNKLAKHLRANGYAAYPGTALGGCDRLCVLGGVGRAGGGRLSRAVDLPRDRRTPTDQHGLHQYRKPADSGSRGQRTPMGARFLRDVP